MRDMRAKLSAAILFFLILGSFWGTTPVAASGVSADHWIESCEVNQEAAENIIINEYGEKIYHNVDRKVLWELAGDFCISLDLLVAYNFVLFPRKPDQYDYIKIPPSYDEIGWVPGYSLERPDNLPNHLAEHFYFEETPTDQFAWPVNQQVGVVSQLYHPMHRGVDIAVRTGTPIQSIGNGRVIRVEENHRIYGKVVMIDHGNDIMGIYAHLSKINVKLDQFVSREEHVGISGNTGHSSAPHLHFELRDAFRVTNPCDYYPDCPAEAFHGPRSSDEGD